MEGCLLCFQNHKEYVGYIQANSTHWMELNVHNIIEKHLWSIVSGTIENLLNSLIIFYFFLN